MSSIPSAAEIVNALSGDPNTGMCHCPAHDDKKASLSVKQENGKVLLHCFAGCSFEAVRDELISRGLWPKAKTNGSRPRYRPRQTSSGDKEADKEERARKLIALIQGSKRAASTYLNSRGIDPTPPDAKLIDAEDAVQFTGQRYPAMGLVIVGADGKPQGAQLTLLSHDLKGKARVETQKWSFGHVSRGYVTLGEPDPEKPLLVAEGYEDAATVAQITGWPAIATLGLANFGKVEVPPSSMVVIAVDNDKDRKSFREAMKLAARLRDRSVRIAEPPEGTKDFNEALQKGVPDLDKLIANAPDYGAAEREAKLDELAALSRLEYEARRKAEAANMGMRVSLLDEEVAKRRTVEPEEEGFLASPKPWGEPVDGIQLLDEICETLKKHLVLSKHRDVAIAVWALHAHAHDAARHSPILFVSSPTKRCGKTNLLSLLGHLVPKALPAANVTPATVFRAIAKWQPTMLIDEADTFISDKSELRGVLDSGHNRAAAFVLRCVGDEHEVAQFPTWCPKVFCAIGRIHPTLEDRAITIGLRRKLLTEEVERIPSKSEKFDELRGKAARWAADHLGALSLAEPRLPQELNDRARDNWEPLLAIAEACGEEWAERARKAAVVLSAWDDDETPSIMLLEDLRFLFEDAAKEWGEPVNIGSAQIATQLGGMEDRPWPEWKHGKPITTRQVAALLKPFAIFPRKVRLPSGARQVQGYGPKQFASTFRRYLSPLEPLSTGKSNG